MATLILLGAGASFGSEPDRGIITPPLGADLFQALESRNGIAASMPQYIKDVFIEDFELGMELFNKKHSALLQGFHRELSLYLSCFRPTDKSYCFELIKRFGKKNIIFSTLNYDMMLEDAITDAGLSFHYGSARNAPSIRVLKPHGSLNFWPDNSPSQFTGCVFEGNGEDYEGDVKPLSKLDSIHRCTIDDSLAPAIAMYAKGKKVKICSSFILQQQSMFAQACRHASRIIILGVRVVQEDAHIWGPISDSNADLFYFGNSDDERVLSSWAFASKRKNVIFVSGYFDTLISEMHNFY